MNRFHSLFVASSLVLTALALSGCGDTQPAAPHAEHEAVACTYKAGHGVQLSATARAFAGLTTTMVAPHGDAETAVPLEAVLSTATGPVVFVANGESFLRTPVSVGRKTATHIAITDGLYEGDLVAVKGVRTLALAEIQAVNGGVGCADGH